ncbi:phytanoyl-CoA dioxygenase [Aspergillus karnatakaensis]|uniref:phytanoyl-CoA dioxygenase family protein n=1 Tax=Aspergillus karnatakaensis TaxID=1810916 RepID=UPI003CCD302C
MASVAHEAQTFIYPPIPILADRTPYNDFRDQLQKEGYAVVKSAVSRDRAAAYQQKAFQWLNSFNTDLDIADPSTWRSDNLPAMNGVRLFHAYGVAHEKFMWDARMESGVLSTFAKLWGTSELLVSFDCLNVTFPNMPDLPARQPWQHVDQSPNKRGLHCVQGIINLSSSGIHDGGLVVYPGSHLLHDEFFNAHPDRAGRQFRKDVYLFPDAELAWFEERGLRPHKVCAEPGDLILWDSRTIHYGSDPTEKGTQIRTAIYATYMPASLATTDQLERKKKVFKEYAATTHWPFEHIEPGSRRALPFLSNGEVDPRVAERNKPLEMPEMSDALLKLAGAMAY